MKTYMISIPFFEAGDFVSTPDGKGIVTEDESIPNNRMDLFSNWVKIQYAQPHREIMPKDVDSESVHFLTKEEFDNY